MSCKNKIKNTCVSKQYATCVYYELDLPEISSLDSSCVTLEETTQELYSFIEYIKESVNIEGLTTDCEDLTELSIKDIFELQQNKICSLEDKVEELESKTICDMSITECGLDLQNIVDICGEQPETVSELLQILINQINQE